MNIPAPLLDRMEVIRIPGYTEDEKVNIARRYLLPKQIKANGLRKNEMEVKDEELLTIIRLYTKEAGVRGLERQLASYADALLNQMFLIAIKRHKSLMLKSLKNT